METLEPESSELVESKSGWDNETAEPGSANPEKDLIWNSSGDSCYTGGKRAGFTSLFPISMDSLEIDHLRIDGGRHPFLCVLLAQERELDIPFGTKMGLIDYLFHRLEKACYDFTQRSLPQLFGLMRLKSHDQYDLKTWVMLLGEWQSVEWPRSISERAVIDRLAAEIRNTAVHLNDYGFGLLRQAIGWMAHLGDEAGLDETQQILKIIYHDQCKVEGNADPTWEVSQDDRATYEKAMGLTWNQPLTRHQLQNMTVKALQKACFQFWVKHKAEDDTKEWTCPEQIELQHWYQSYSHVFAGLVPQHTALLETANKLRNATAHRYELSSGRFHQCIRLLTLLGDSKSALKISIAEIACHFTSSNI